MTNQTYTAPTYMLPDLVEIQRSSFRWFLEEGLIEELNSFSPITDYTGKMELHFLGKNYKLKRPKYDVDEAKRRDSTYAVQMYVPYTPYQQRNWRDQGTRSLHRRPPLDDRPRHLHH
jgi:DNA-directed RNA polymerase subunit beta